MAIRGYAKGEDDIIKDPQSIMSDLETIDVNDPNTTNAEKAASINGAASILDGTVPIENHGHQVNVESYRTGLGTRNYSVDVGLNTLTVNEADKVSALNQKAINIIDGRAEYLKDNLFKREPSFKFTSFFIPK